MKRFEEVVTDLSQTRLDREEIIRQTGSMGTSPGVRSDKRDVGSEKTHMGDTEPLTAD